MKLILASFLFLVFLSPAAQTQDHALQDGYEVLEAMYRQYEGKWYKNFRFKQMTTFYGPDKQVVRRQVWYEAMTLPGRLAIKFDQKNSNNGILFRNGEQYGFANGQLIQQMTRVHDLLVLGFDVYHQDPAKTAEQLKENGYDLSKLYMDVWQGRRVYVVGVSEADTTKPQFWIDAERMVFVRNFTLGRANTIQEVQFNNYERMGEGWVAPEVIFKANGQIGLLEEYTDMEIPDQLNMKLFDPETFIEATWDSKPEE